MNQLPELPELQIVPTDSLHPHEEIEPGRARGLIRSLQTEGFLKNPPVVLQIPRRLNIREGSTIMAAACAEAEGPRCPLASRECERSQTERVG